MYRGAPDIPLSSFWIISAFWIAAIRLAWTMEIIRGLRSCHSVCLETTVCRFEPICISCSEDSEGRFKDQPEYRIEPYPSHHRIRHRERRNLGSRICC
ncbi:hypothetical protein FOZ60_011540 [Perkinsus olseni]|uniref:Uncharacterized protein n=1 Tax=Perkinsus olseni TaxID=32597 RepID=A0A7J6NIH1_PEROL|nr:hypothetical protein FOZ60_011540 [Perkinsus olseni]KAF4682861.1 hypothetical protein FOZ62_023261 [Perkinsus olseni]